MSVQRAARAEKMLQHISRMAGGTPAGEHWMSHALDPFKDITTPMDGYPDSIASPSVVEVIRDSIIVSAPGVVNWDTNIFLDQAYLSTDLYSASVGLNRNSYNAGGQGATPYKRGGLIVRSAAAGVTLNIDQTINAQCLSMKADVFGSTSSNTGEGRVIAIGMEIHNTTAPLNKQGSVVCWKDDQPLDERVMTAQYDNGISAQSPTAYHTVRMNAPPATASEALDLTGSVEWKASEGAYIIPHLMEPINPPKKLSNMMLVDAATTNYTNLLVVTGAFRNISLANTDVNIPLPWTMTGAFFQGLSPESTLKVDLTYYVEVFPDKANVLRRLATPSPGPDPIAMRLYAAVLAKLPVAVPVKDNFLGALIAGIAAIAKIVIPHIPTAIAVGSGIYEAVKAVNAPLTQEQQDAKDRAYMANENKIRLKNEAEYFRTSILPNRLAGRSDGGDFCKTSTGRKTVRPSPTRSVGTGPQKVKALQPMSFVIQPPKKQKKKAQDGWSKGPGHLREIAQKSTTRSGSTWVNL